MAEHALRYGRFASALNTYGYVVWAHDQRGHGQNPTPPVGLGHFADRDGWRALVNDAASVSKQIGEAYPRIPLFLFGHSMGSFAAQSLMAANGEDYRGVVLAGSDGPRGASEAAIRALARLQCIVLGGRAPGMWLDSLVFGAYNRQFRPNRTRFDWLSRDDMEVDKYVADKLCGFPLSAQSWSDFLIGKAQLVTNEHVDRIPKSLPIFIIGGYSDPVGANAAGLEKLRRLYEGRGLMCVQHRFYGNARHELLTEINREEVTQDIIQWLDTTSR
jgi:alpha-beta hydrolase superfamily lysophospholipase